MKTKHLGIAFLLFGIVLLFSCTSEMEPSKGLVTAHTLSSDILGREINYISYQAARADTTKPYEFLIFLLHGHGGDEQDWFQEEEGNVATLLDSLQQHNLIPPVLAVSMNAGNSWYVDRHESMESFFMEEYIPHIKSVFNLKETPYSILAGNSAGGYGSLRFALKYPDKFEEVILLSPASYHPLPPAISSSRKIDVFAKDGSFNDSIWNSYSYKNLLPAFFSSEKHPNFYLSVGDDDAYNIVPVVTELQQTLLEAKVPCELRITNGGHDWVCWKENFASALVMIFEGEE